jgi:hypothetical protein
MNSYQLNVVIAGAFIIGALILYPPWVSVTGDQPAKSIGYALIWDSPEPFYPKPSVVGADQAVPAVQIKPSTSIDFMRLISQCVLVAMLTAVSALYTKGPRQKNYGSLRQQVEKNVR